MQLFKKKRKTDGWLPGGKEGEMGSDFLMIVLLGFFPKWPRMVHTLKSLQFRRKSSLDTFASCSVTLV